MPAASADALLQAGAAGELVKLAVARAAEERDPLLAGKAEDRAVRVTAVPDADLASGQAGDLHAVAEGVTEAALHPGDWCYGVAVSFGWAVELGACHWTP